MTNGEKYKIKKLATTIGLKVGDLVGDGSILYHKAEKTKINHYEYEITEIIDSNHVMIKGHFNDFPVSCFFLLPSHKDYVYRYNHPLTPMFLSDKKYENYKYNQKNPESDQIKIDFE